MSVVVIVPPAPIVTPADIPGPHAPDDATLTALIAAATEEIDGPTGWVGRAFGPQTLELQRDRFMECGDVVVRLPCPPLIDVVSVKYDDAGGIEQTLDSATYGIFDGRGIYPKPGQAWPATACQPGSVRIRYRAGYAKRDAQGVLEQGQDGALVANVPARAKQAVILAVRSLQSVGKEDLFLRSDQVEGIGMKQWTVSDVATKVIRETAERLLSGLRVYA